MQAGQVQRQVFSELHFSCQKASFPLWSGGFDRFQFFASWRGKWMLTEHVPLEFYSELHIRTNVDHMGIHWLQKCPFLHRWLLAGKGYPDRASKEIITPALLSPLLFTFTNFCTLSKLSCQSPSAHWWTLKVATENRSISCNFLSKNQSAETLLITQA